MWLEGPPARLSKKEQTVQLLKKSVEACPIIKTDQSPPKDQKQVESVHIPKNEESKEKDLKTPESKTSRLSNDSIFSNKPSVEQSKEDTIKAKDNALSNDAMKEYVIPIKEEDEPVREKKVIKVNCYFLIIS